MVYGVGQDAGRGPQRRCQRRGFAGQGDRRCRGGRADDRPFARLAGPVIDACLTARSPYVYIANEWSAVRDLLDRDEQARGREVALVTGAGFRPAATETLVLRLVGQPRTVPARVHVAAAAQVSRHGEGVRRTIEESISQGAITYRNGQSVREPLGSGATVLTFGAAHRRMLPGPVGDLEAAKRASGAPDVVASLRTWPGQSAGAAPASGPRSSPGTGAVPWPNW
jgi:hypothetical protein